MLFHFASDPHGLFNNLWKNMKHILITILIIIVSTTSCKPPNEVTVKELVQVADIKWWRIKITETNKSEKTNLFGLQLIKPNKQKFGGSGSNRKVGEEIKLFIFNLDQERISYSIIGKTTKGKGTMPNHFLEWDKTFYFKNGTLVKNGDLLIQFSKNSNVTSSVINEDEIGLTLDWCVN